MKQLTMKFNIIYPNLSANVKRSIRILKFKLVFVISVFYNFNDIFVMTASKLLHLF